MWHRERWKEAQVSFYQDALMQGIFHFLSCAIFRAFSSRGFATILRIAATMPLESVISRSSFSLFGRANHFIMEEQTSEE